MTDDLFAHVPDRWMRWFPEDLWLERLTEQLVELPDWARLRNSDPRSVRDWIKAACEKLKLTPSKLAKRSDVAASTINRFLRDNPPGSNLSGTTLDKIQTEIRHLAADYLLIETPFRRKTFEIEVIGSVGDQGRWYKSDERYSVTVPIPQEAVNDELCAFEIEGDRYRPAYHAPGLIFGYFAPNLTFSEWPDRTNYIVLRKEGERVFLDLAEFTVDPKNYAWLMPVGDRDAMPFSLGKAKKAQVVDSAEILPIGPVISTYQLVNPGK